MDAKSPYHLDMETAIRKSCNCVEHTMQGIAFTLGVQVGMEAARRIFSDNHTGPFTDDEYWAMAKEVLDNAPSREALLRLVHTAD